MLSISNSENSGVDQITVPDAIAYQASIRPGAPAFTYLSGDGASVSITFGELAMRVASHAAVYRDNYETGSRVLIALPGDLNFVVQLLAVISARLVAVPVYPPLDSTSSVTISRIARIAADCAPQTVVSHETALRDTLAINAEFIQPPHQLSQVPPGGVVVPTNPQDIALLQYTSGSTGDPKGVMISNAAIAANSALLSDALGLTPDSTVVSWLPLYHDMGLMGHVFHPLFVGMHSVLMPTALFVARPMAWLETISKYRARVSSAPDFAYRLCAQLPKVRIARAELDLSCWDMALNGSEPVRLSTMNEFAHRFAEKGFRRSAFFPCYGLAESTLYVSGAQFHDEPHLEGDSSSSVSCGSVSPGVQIAIVNPETLETAPAGEPGEIWVSSPSNGSGYWQRPELSKATFSAQIAAHSGRHFLRTGDIGFVKDGNLYISGRLKNLIIIRGRNLHAEDIEEFLTETVAGIRGGRICAVSVQHASAEHLCLIAEVAPSQDMDEMERAVRSQTFRYAEVQPLWVVFVAPKSLPRTSSGKLRRQKCAELLLSNQLPTLGGYLSRPQVSTAEPTNWLEAICVDACREALDTTAPISVKHDFFADLNMDSLSATVYSGILSDKTGKHLSTGDIYKFSTPAALALRVQELYDTNESNGVSAWDPELGLDFDAEADLGSLIRDRLQTVPDLASKIAVSHQAAFERGGTILLTGATGFLGPHLVDQLLRQTDAKLICVIRASDDEQAMDRLRKDMSRYRIWDESLTQRVSCLAGDISRENLGLNDVVYDRLCREVSVVFSNAAYVNFLMPYSRLKAANVQGVRNLIQMCLQGKVKHLVHTSTQGIYEAKGPHTVYAEDAPPTGDVVRVAKGYARTKLVAEHLINRVRESAFSATLLRVGMVSGDSVHGISNGDPLIGSLVLGCAQCGAAPDADVTFDMSPVDQVARAMVAIARQHQSIGGNFNISKREGISTETIYSLIRQMGIELEVLPFPQWRERVFEQGERNALSHYRWILKELTSVPPRAFFEVHRAEELLRSAGVSPPNIDAEVFTKYFDFYRNEHRYPII